MSRVFLALVAAAATVPAIASPNGPVLRPEDSLDVATVGAPAVSPDGRWIVYPVTRFDRDTGESDGDLFLVPFAGGAARRLTAVPGVESDPAWRPDSGAVAFVARRGTDTPQVFVIDVDGGEARQLSHLASGAAAPAYSPDGRWIAFTSEVGSLYTEAESEVLGDVRLVRHPRYYHLGPGWDEGARRRIFVMPAAGGEARQLTSGEASDEGDHSFVWSPDSATIAFVSNRSPEWWNTIDTDIYAVDVASGATHRLTDNPGPDHDPAYSRDGRWIAWRGSDEYNYESENYTVRVMPAAGGPVRELAASLDRDVRELAWGPGSDRIVVLVQSEGHTNLMAVRTDRPDQLETVNAEPANLRDLRVVDDRRFVARNSTDVAPNEVYTLVDGVLTPRTDAATAFWSRFDVAPAEEMRLTAADGTSLQGWLIRPTRPEGDAPPPLVLVIHGGPHGMFAPTLRFSFQLLAQQGFAVLFANPRGSAGYGQAFADSIHEDWHTKPFADLMAFVDRAVEIGAADPERLGVTGGSYGGYMTNWILGHTDRFAAAVSVAGLSNLVSFYGTTDEQFFIEKEMAGVPWEKRDVYLSNSPLWSAARFTTPTLVVHGANDWRVRPEQGRQLFTALQKVGVPSLYAEFPDEQHGVRGSEHSVVYYHLLTEWFAHWLQGRPVELARYLEPRPFVWPPAPGPGTGKE